MEVQFWDAKWPAIRTAPISRSEVIARAIHDLIRGDEDWVYSASKIAPPPSVGAARVIRRKRLIDRTVTTVRCSKAVYAAVEQWVERLWAEGFRGGPIPQKLPPPR